jgi:pimeloyl-ACP methyl ester carboxylesterase
MALCGAAREAFWNELEPAYDLAGSGHLDAAMKAGLKLFFGLGIGGFKKLDPRAQAVFLQNTHTMLPDLNAEPAEPLTRAELEEVSCPVLIVRGEQTHAQYRIMADAAQALVRDGSSVELMGLGHGGPVQAPALVADTILEFVASVAG